MRRQMLTALILMAPAAGLAAQDTTQTRQDTTMMRTPDQTVHTQAGPQDDNAVILQMHRTNQHEIRAGQLAQRNGGSARIKSFGAQLVRDHRSADQKVTALARQMGVALPMGQGADSSADRPRQDEQAANRRGERQDTTQQQPRQDTTQEQQRQDTVEMRGQQDQFGPNQAAASDTTDPEKVLQRLTTLRGAAFDAEFAKAMVQGHAKTIAMLEEAQGTVQREELRTLIRNTLPTVRRHHQLAQSLQASSTATTGSEQ